MKKFICVLVLILTIVGVFMTAPTLQEPQSALILNKYYVPAHSYTQIELVPKYEYDFISQEYHTRWANEPVTHYCPDQYTITIEYTSQNEKVLTRTFDVDSTYYMKVERGQEVVIQESWSNFWGSFGVYLK